MQTFTNEHDKKLLQIIFKDGDVIHIRPGETFRTSTRYTVLKTLYV